MTAAVAHQANFYPAQVLAERMLGWLPVVILAYPLLVWPMAFGVAESSRGLMEVATQIQETNIFNRLFFPLVLLTALTALLVVPVGRLRPLLSPPIVLMLVFLAWSALSVVWALDPGIALRRLIAQSCLLGALVLSVIGMRDAEALIRRVFALAAVAALFNAVAVASGPPGPLGYEGIYTQKNTLGAASSLMLFLALFVVFGRGTGMRLLGLLVLIISAVLLVASESKTSLGVAILAPVLALALAVCARALRVSAAVMLTALISVIVLTYYLGLGLHLWDFGVVAGALFGDPTLTSRTDIWAFVMEMIARRPMLGFGYESFWGIGYEGPAHREAPGFVSQMPHSHNGYLDVVLQTGLVGFAILIVFLLAALHAASSPALPFRLSWLVLCLVVDSIASNLLESGWFHSLNFSWISFVIVVALAAKMQRPGTAGAARTAGTLRPDRVPQVG